MTAADKIAEARALIEPLTGHTPGPWAVSYPVTDRPECAFIDPECGYIEGQNYLSVSGICNPATALTLAAAPALRATVAALADLADAQAQENARLRDALRLIDRASEHYSQRGYDADALRYAHDSTGRLAREALGDTQ